MRHDVSTQIQRHAAFITYENIQRNWNVPLVQKSGTEGIVKILYYVSMWMLFLIMVI